MPAEELPVVEIVPELLIAQGVPEPPLMASLLVAVTLPVLVMVTGLFVDPK